MVAKRQGRRSRPRNYPARQNRTARQRGKQHKRRQVKVLGELVQMPGRIRLGRQHLVNAPASRSRSNRRHSLQPHATPQTADTPRPSTQQPLNLCAVGDITSDEGDPGTQLQLCSSPGTLGVASPAYWPNKWPAPCPASQRGSRPPKVPVPPVMSTVRLAALQPSLRDAYPGELAQDAVTNTPASALPPDPQHPFRPAHHTAAPAPPIRLAGQVDKAAPTLRVPNPTTRPKPPYPLKRCLKPIRGSHRHGTTCRYPSLPYCHIPSTCDQRQQAGQTRWDARPPRDRLIPSNAIHEYTPSTAKSSPDRTLQRAPHATAHPTHSDPARTDRASTASDSNTSPSQAPHRTQDQLIIRQAPRKNHQPHTRKSRI